VGQIRRLKSYQIRFCRRPSERGPESRWTRLYWTDTNCSGFRLGNQAVTPGGTVPAWYPSGFSSAVVGLGQIMARTGKVALQARTVLGGVGTRNVAHSTAFWACKEREMTTILVSIGSCVDDFTVSDVTLVQRVNKESGEASDAGATDARHSSLARLAQRVGQAESRAARWREFKEERVQYCSHYITTTRSAKGACIFLLHIHLFSRPLTICAFAGSSHFILHIQCLPTFN
jgi:hypothetical protein